MTRGFHTGFFLWLIVSSWIGQAADCNGNGRDFTAHYQKLHAEDDQRLFKTSVLPQLRGYKVLLVPGFFANVVLKLGRSGVLRSARVGEYFDDQLRWFREVGIECERVQIRSEKEPEINARILAKIIRDSDKPIIIFAHSKGGIDTLETLVTYPDTRQKVRGVVTIQTPYHGVPVADLMYRWLGLRYAVLGVLKIFGGTKQAMISLTSETRLRYLVDHQEDIQQLTKAVHILSVAGWKAPQAGRVDTLLKIPRDIMYWSNIASDGLLPRDNSVLPGAAYVVIEGLDHLAPVMYNHIDSFDRVRFTRTLMSIWVEMVSQSESGVW